MSTARETESKAWLTLSSIGSALSLAAAIAVPLYAVGYIGLAAQIATSYTGDFSTAFYAASLVPNKVIVGQGLRAFWTEPILSIIFLLGVLYQAHSNQRPVSNTGFYRAIVFQGDWRKYKALPLWIGRLVFLIVLLAPVLALVDILRTGNTIHWASAIHAVTVIGVGYVIQKGRESRVPRITYYLASILLLYIGMIVFLIFVADLEEPPLPQVELQRASSEVKVTGRLVAHSDGYWHVLITGKLVAVKDDTVGTATLSP